MLRQFYTDLREVIGNDVSHFAKVFYLKGFISTQTRSKITRLQCFEERVKADQLLDEVFSHLENTGDKESRFHEFTTIFLTQAAHRELANNLNMYYSGKMHFVIIMHLMLSLLSPW